MDHGLSNQAMATNSIAIKQAQPQVFEVKLLNELNDDCEGPSKL